MICPAEKCLSQRWPYWLISASEGTGMWKVQWSENGETEVASVDELDAVLDGLHNAGLPLLVVVESSNQGDSLAIGLGRNVSVLNFVCGTGEPASFTSLGLDERDEPVEFNFMGAQSEFPLRNTIPVAVARQALREFIQTGGRTSSITWEQD